MTARTLTITNAGPAELSFEVYGGVPVAGSVLLIHLDEPAGSTLFLDDSGYENHGVCSGGSCPVAGVPGRFGTALEFDGVNDWLSVSDAPSLNPEEAIAISAWIYPYD